MADVLIAAAGAAAAALTKKRGASRCAARPVHTAAGAVAGVVTDAARHFLPAALLAEEPAPARAQNPQAPPVRKVKVTVASASPKKRKASVRKSVTALRSLAEDRRNLIAARSRFSVGADAPALVHPPPKTVAFPAKHC